MLVDAPRDARVIPSRVDERADAREEEEEIEREVERRLGARLEVAVQEVAAHVPVLRERIRPAQHEKRAVEEVVEVEDVGGRRVEDVALEDLDAHHEGKADHEPRGGFAHKGADAVGEEEETLDVHVRALVVFLNKTGQRPSTLPGRI